MDTTTGISQGSLGDTWIAPNDYTLREQPEFILNLR